MRALVIAEIFRALVFKRTDLFSHRHLRRAHLIGSGGDFFFAEGGFVQSHYLVRHGVTFTLSLQ